MEATKETTGETTGEISEKVIEETIENIPHHDFPELKWRYRYGACVGHCRTKADADKTIAAIKRRYTKAGALKKNIMTKYGANNVYNSNL
jgi:bacterioferritin-associated ferredoxin